MSLTTITTTSTSMRTMALSNQVVAEAVNHPSHYLAESGIEVIDAIDAWGLGFCEGNVVKYVARARHKGRELEDLKKARWYLEHAIQQLERPAPPPRAQRCVSPAGPEPPCACNEKDRYASGGEEQADNPSQPGGNGEPKAKGQCVHDDEPHI
jgi:hypothetical protein